MSDAIERPERKGSIVSMGENYSLSSLLVDSKAPPLEKTVSNTLRIIVRINVLPKPKSSNSG